MTFDTSGPLIFGASGPTLVFNMIIVTRLQLQNDTKSLIMDGTIAAPLFDYH